MVLIALRAMRDARIGLTGRVEYNGFEQIAREREEVEIMLPRSEQATKALPQSRTTGSHGSRHSIIGKCCRLERK